MIFWPHFINHLHTQCVCMAILLTSVCVSESLVSIDWSFCLSVCLSRFMYAIFVYVCVCRVCNVHLYTYIHTYVHMYIYNRYVHMCMCSCILLVYVCMWVYWGCNSFMVKWGPPQIIDLYINIGYCTTLRGTCTHFHSISTPLVFLSFSSLIIDLSV